MMDFRVQMYSYLFVTLRVYPPWNFLKDRWGFPDLTLETTGLGHVQTIYNLQFRHLADALNPERLTTSQLFHNKWGLIAKQLLLLSSQINEIFLCPFVSSPELHHQSGFSVPEVNEQRRHSVINVVNTSFTSPN